MLQRLHLNQDASHIWQAAYNGNLEWVQQLLSNGVDCFSCDPICRCTPIQIASWRGNTQVVRLLLGDTTTGVGHPAVHIHDMDGFYPLHYAMRGLHIEIARLLIACGADANLNIAVGYGHHFRGDNSPENAPVLWAANSKLPHDEHPCIGNHVPTTMVEWVNRRLLMMRLLFSHGAEVPPSHAPLGYFSLWENAVGLNQYREDDTPHTGMLELLIEYDRVSASITPHSGWTVAHSVVGMNYWERRHGHDIAMLKVLAAHGYNLQGNHGSRRTPLHMAACDDKPDIVQFLLDAGVDLEREDFMNESDFGGYGECWDLIERAHYLARRKAFEQSCRVPDEMVDHVFSFIHPHDFYR